MRTTLFTWIGLLTFPMLTLAQYQGQAVKLEPAQPRPGQTITITYSPAGTKLANASAIDGIVYWLRPTGVPIAQDFTPVKSGAVYRATIAVPDSVKGLALIFEKGKTKDNNQNKTYAFLLYGPDGKPQPGGYASLSKIYGLDFYYLGSEDRDPDTAQRLMQQEIALYPKAKRQYMSDYLYSFNAGDEIGRKALAAELESYAALTDLTQEEMEYLTYFYQQLGKKELADAMTKRGEQTFGKPFDWDEAYQRFGDPQLSLAQKKAEYAILKQESAKANQPYVTHYLRYSYSIYLKTLADSTKWADFQALIQSAPADYKPNTMGAYNAIAWDWAEKGKNLEKAADLSKEGTEWAKGHIKAPREAIDPVYQTDAQLQKARLNAYGTYADTYGYILLKQGKLPQALPYLKEAAKATEGANADINQRYIQALTQVDPSAVLEVVEPLIAENNSSELIEEALKTAYVKTHAGESGFDAYLARLKKKGIEHHKAQLREKLIRRPAPAFNLVNLDGQSVGLADLKGKTVIVDFWATWCGPCIASFPGMQNVVEKFKADPKVAFVFVNCRQTETDKKKNAADFMAKKGYTFDVLLDEDNEVYNQFGVAGIPTKFIIDRTGVIRFKSAGFMGNTAALVNELSLMIELANEPLN